MATVGIYLVFIAVFVGLLVRGILVRAIAPERLAYEPSDHERVPEMARSIDACSKEGFTLAGFLTTRWDRARGELGRERGPFDRAIAVLVSQDRRTMLLLSTTMNETIITRPVPVLVSFVGERALVTTAGLREPYRPMPREEVVRVRAASVAALLRVHRERLRGLEADALGPDEAIERFEAMTRAETAQHIELGEWVVRDGYVYHSPMAALLGVLFVYVESIAARLRQMIALIVVGTGAAIATHLLVPEETRVWAAGIELVGIAAVAGIVLREGFGTAGYVVLTVLAGVLAITGDGHWVAGVAALVVGMLASVQMMRRKPAPEPPDERGEPRRGSLDRALYTLAPACVAIGIVLGGAIFVYTLTPVEEINRFMVLSPVLTLPFMLLVVVVLLGSLVATFALPQHHRGRRVVTAIAWIPSLAFAGFIGAGELERTSEEETLDHARSIAALLDRHHVAHGEYPATLGALVEFASEPIPSSVVGWHHEPLDYRVAGSGYELSYRSPSGRQFYWPSIRQFMHHPPP